MDNMNNNSGRAPVRHKLKKVKRPIKRPAGAMDAISVPQKTDNSFAPQQNLGSAPAMSMAAINNYPQDTGSSQENIDAFNLDAFLDNDNLPAIQPQAEVQQDNFEHNFIRDEDLIPAKQSWREKMMVGDLYTGFAVFVTAAVFLLFGMMFTKIFLSGPTTVQNGLQGVVINSEVPRGRARCGVAEKTQGCVLYIMNPQRQDLNGRDFYDLAAQLTGRQRFMIETGNMRYSSQKIRPGEIAQLNIPPLQ